MRRMNSATIKLVLVFGILMFGGCVTTPTLISETPTYGYMVRHYSDGSQHAYEIVDRRGNVVSVVDILGLANWKQQRLLDLIGDPNTTDSMRERYKLEYQDLSQKIVAANTIIANQNFAQQLERQQIHRSNLNRIQQDSDARTNAIFAKKWGER